MYRLDSMVLMKIYCTQIHFRLKLRDTFRQSPSFPTLMLIFQECNFLCSSKKFGVSFVKVFAFVLEIIVSVFVSVCAVWENAFQVLEDDDR